MITMTTALTGVLLVFLGYLIGIIHGAVTAVKENKKDRDDLETMTKLCAKMAAKLEEMIGEDDK